MFSFLLNYGESLNGEPSEKNVIQFDAHTATQWPYLRSVFLRYIPLQLDRLSALYNCSRNLAL